MRFFLLLKINLIFVQIDVHLNIKLIEEGEVELSEYRNYFKKRSTTRLYILIVRLLITSQSQVVIALWSYWRMCGKFYIVLDIRIRENTI